MDVETVCNSFFQDNKASASSVLLSYQRQNIKQNTSPSFLINYIINTEEFKKYYDDVFVCVLSSVLIGTNDNSLVNEMKKKFITNQMKSQKGFNRYDIETFLKEESCFNDHYREVIKNLHSFYYSGNINEDKMNTVLNQFKEIDFINTNSQLLKRKMEQIVFDSFQKTNKTISSSTKLEDYKQYFVDKFGKTFDREPDVNDLVCFNRFFENKETLVDMYLSNKYQKKSTFTTSIIDCFSQTFNRDISVYEYVKYYDFFSDNVEYNIKEYHKNFLKKYGIMSNIFSTYLDKSTNHTEFIHLYLDYVELDDQEFMDKIIDLTIKYETYEIVMKEKIKTIYKSSFNTNISIIDLEYFFKQVRNEKLSLMDECLPKSVTLLKEETETFENTMRSKFKIILQRDPDRSEMDIYIEYFREVDDNNLRPEITLENELYESLEYHDIVKQIIITIFQDKTKLVPNKSIVFKHLSNILHSTDSSTKRNIDMIKEYLDRYI